MKLLALDCATQACSVAVYENSADAECAGGQVLAAQHHLAPREHTQKLLPMIESVLAEAQVSLYQLDAIAYGRGPGSFTGLRIALGAVQGLAYGANLPVIPVSTLAALAQTAMDDKLLTTTTVQRIIACIDARMDEVYWADYRLQEGELHPLSAEQLSAPEAVKGVASDALGVGSGWCYADRIPAVDSLQAIYVDCLPKAAAIARLAESAWRRGEAVAAEQALPVYLRDEVAWQKPAERTA